MTDPLATFWAQATAGVNYYRARLPARHLPGKVVKLAPFDLKPGGQEGEYRFPRQEGETAIWLFPGNTTRALLIAQMKAQGIRVLVEADDNYLLHPPLQVSRWQEKFDGTDSHSYEVFSKISRFADGMIVSTPKLAEVYEPLNQEIHVCRNSIDPADWPEPSHQKDGILRIGWAASDSHVYDAPLILDALEWASRQPNVEVVIIGIHPDFARYRFPYRHVEWTDSLSQYRRNVGLIDVMLCPLRQGEWEDCKSDVKALEGAMGGACVVVSKVEPYRPWWDGEAPGLVAEHPWDFKKIVKHLVRRREETRVLAEAAREYVLEHRDIRRTASAWRDAVGVKERVAA